MSRLQDLLRIHFNSKRKHPLLIVGPTGVGKTQSVRQFAASVGVSLYEYRAAYSEPGDLKGLCREDDGDVMSFLRPADFPPVTDKNCILFFDELNRAPPNVMNCIMQAADGSGRIATHELPEGCLVVAAINPANLTYHHANALEAAMANRFGIVEVEFDRGSLLAWARKNSWHPKVVAFISLEKRLFSEESTRFDGTHNFASSRTLEAMSDFENEGLASDRELHRIESVAQLGPLLGMEYHQFALGSQPVTVRELFTSNKKAMKRLREFSNPASLRSDMLSLTTDDLVDWLKKTGAESYAADGSAQKIVTTYLTAVPPDLAAGAIKAICEEDPAFISVFSREKTLAEHLGRTRPGPNVGDQT